MPRSANKFLRERATFRVENAALTATATTVVEKLTRAARIVGVKIYNPTGLVTHADNWFAMTVQFDAVVAATWSTDTGQEGTITAATHMDLTNSVVAGALNGAAGSQLKVVYTEGGTATLPVGHMEIELEYI